MTVGTILDDFGWFAPWQHNMIQTCSISSTKDPNSKDTWNSNSFCWEHTENMKCHQCSLPVPKHCNTIPETSQQRHDSTKPRHHPHRILGILDTGSPWKVCSVVPYVSEDVEAWLPGTPAQNLYNSKWCSMIRQDLCVVGNSVTRSFTLLLFGWLDRGQRMEWGWRRKRFFCEATSQEEAISTCSTTPAIQSIDAGQVRWVLRPLRSHLAGAGAHRMNTREGSQRCIDIFLFWW